MMGMRIGEFERQCSRRFDSLQGRAFQMKTDDDLMLAFASGSDHAFAQLHRRHASQLQGWLYRQLRDTHAAEDLTQEVFIQIHRSRKDYTPGHSFTGWLYRIARNLLISTARRKHAEKRRMDRTQQLGGEQDNDDTDFITRVASTLQDPAEAMGDREFAETVDGLLAGLPDDQKTTFVLSVYCGLSCTEIGVVTQCCTATVKGRLRLAKAALRGRLRGCVVGDLRESEFA